MELSISNGYLVIGNLLVHRVVALAFLDNELAEVNHIDGNKLNSFPSIIEAARQTGIADSEIGKAKRGLRPNAGGYIWR